MAAADPWPGDDERRTQMLVYADMVHEEDKPALAAFIRRAARRDLRPGWAYAFVPSRASADNPVQPAASFWRAGARRHNTGEYDVHIRTPAGIQERDGRNRYHYFVSRFGAGEGEEVRRTLDALRSEGAGLDASAEPFASPAEPPPERHARLTLGDGMHPLSSERYRRRGSPERYAADPRFELAEVHPDFRPDGVAPRVGRALAHLTKTLDTESPAHENAALLLKLGPDHENFVRLGQSLADEGHPLAGAYNWERVHPGVELDRRVRAAVMAHPDFHQDVRERMSARAVPFIGHNPRVATAMALRAAAVHALRNPEELPRPLRDAGIHPDALRASLERAIGHAGEYVMWHLGGPDGAVHEGIEADSLNPPEYQPYHRYRRQGSPARYGAVPVPEHPSYRPRGVAADVGRTLRELVADPDHQREALGLLMRDPDTREAGEAFGRLGAALRSSGHRHAGTHDWDLLARYAGTGIAADAGLGGRTAAPKPTPTPAPAPASKPAPAPAPMTEFEPEPVPVLGPPPYAVPRRDWLDHAADAVAAGAGRLAGSGAARAVAGGARRALHAGSAVARWWEGFKPKLEEFLIGGGADHQATRDARLRAAGATTRHLDDLVSGRHHAAHINADLAAHPNGKHVLKTLADAGYSVARLRHPDGDSYWVSRTPGLAGRLARLHAWTLGKMDGRALDPADGERMGYPAPVLAGLSRMRALVRHGPEQAHKDNPVFAPGAGREAAVTGTEGNRPGHGVRLSGTSLRLRRPGPPRRYEASAPARHPEVTWRVTHLPPGGPAGVREFAAPDFAGALELAASLPHPHSLAALTPDGGHRLVSTRPAWYVRTVKRRGGTGRVDRVTVKDARGHAGHAAFALREHPGFKAAALIHDLTREVLKPDPAVKAALWPFVQKAADTLDLTPLYAGTDHLEESGRAREARAARAFLDRKTGGTRRLKRGGRPRRYARLLAPHELAPFLSGATGNRALDLQVMADRMLDEDDPREPIVRQHALRLRDQGHVGYAGVDALDEPFDPDAPARHSYWASRGLPDGSAIDAATHPRSPHVEFQVHLPRMPGHHGHYATFHGRFTPEEAMAIASRLEEHVPHGARPHHGTLREFVARRFPHVARLRRGGKPRRHARLRTPDEVAGFHASIAAGASRAEKVMPRMALHDFLYDEDDPHADLLARSLDRAEHDRRYAEFVRTRSQGGSPARLDDVVEPHGAGSSWGADYPPYLHLNHQPGSPFVRVTHMTAGPSPRIAAEAFYTLPELAAWSEHPAWPEHARDQFRSFLKEAHEHPAARQRYGRTTARVGCTPAAPPTARTKRVDATCQAWATAAGRPDEAEPHEGSPGGEPVALDRAGDGPRKEKLRALLTRR